MTRENRMGSKDSRVKSHAEHAIETVYGENEAPFGEEEFNDRLRRVRHGMERRAIR
jgi:hypothetical protein